MTIEGVRGQLNALQYEMDSVRASLKAAEQLCMDRKKKIEELEIQVDKDNENIKELEAEIRENELMRKKLHNAIQVREFAAAKWLTV